MFIKPALALIDIVGEAARAEKSGEFQVLYSSPMNFGGGYMVQFFSPRSLQCGTPVYLDRDGEIARLRAEVEGMQRDAERLNYVEKTFSGMTNRERYLPVTMIWGAGAMGRTLRQAVDKYMGREASEGAST